MALSNDQLLERIEAIETTLNEVQKALNKLATKAQLIQLLNIRQAEIVDLQTRVTTLENRVELEHPA